MDNEWRCLERAHSEHNNVKVSARSFVVQGIHLWWASAATVFVPRSGFDAGGRDNSVPWEAVLHESTPPCREPRNAVYANESAAHGRNLVFPDNVESRHSQQIISGSIDCSLCNAP